MKKYFSAAANNFHREYVGTGMQDATNLPKGLDACHALIAELSARLSRHELVVTEKETLLVEQATAIVDLQASREKLTEENEELNLTIQKLLVQLYGHRVEWIDYPSQRKLHL